MGGRARTTETLVLASAGHAVGWPIARGGHLYALGCVGYWLLTGKLIFEGRTVEEVMFLTVSGILGTTMRYQLGRIVTLKLRVQERLYRVRFGGGKPGRSGAPLQISFGGELPFVESAP